MKRQDEMVDSFLIAHRKFMTNLDDSLALIEEELNEAAEIDKICTGEWCTATEETLDELSKFIFAISEPRWVSNEDSKTLKDLRRKVHDLYAKHKGVSH
ncbi:MAG TPA: hypothetical protein EYG88_16140 [Desulfocapsa sulfexigens]|nr:hypothetical protein [Desulfocapsa sulfexigens]